VALAQQANLETREAKNEPRSYAEQRQTWWSEAVDVLGSERGTYAGKTVLVVGSGHSAINAALALLSLQDQDSNTKVLWALRRNRIEKLLGGGLNDQLPERGALGLAAKRARSW